MKTNLLQKNIPKDWSVKKIKDLLDFEQPTKYIVESSSYTPAGKTAVLTANKSFVLGYTNETDGVYTNTPAIIFDDFTTDSKYVNFPFKVKSSAIKILTSQDDNTDLKFVYEIMKSFVFPIANHKRHYISQYQELDIVVPSVKEQKRIAEILSAVDNKIQILDSLISKDEDLKKSIISKSFNKGSVYRIKDVALINQGQINPRNMDGCSFNYIDIGSVKNYGVKNCTNIDNETAPSRARRLVRKNDTLVATVRPNLRNLVFIDFDAKEFVASTGFCVLTPNVKIIDPSFLYYVTFDENFTKYLISKTKGSNYPAVSPQDIGEYGFKIPKLEDQKNIASLLGLIDKRLKIKMELKDKMSLFKKGLVLDLLSGKVRTT
jgi:type I restriction enzyme S subunit